MTLEEVIATGNRGHRMGRNMIHCADGFKMSVIAGGGTYCRPRPVLCPHGLLEGAPEGIDKWLSMRRGADEVDHDFPGPYLEVEVGFPTERPEPWDEWSRYAETKEAPTQTVYAYVPVDMVRALAESHGGERTHV